ncbi:hypothetical protein F5Y16DRAFT_397661 [Xylariaceae sp. FL0255]|nr:hypothetical protein F5Y16DRAFT_397661 [Xylariaceae sp. FL0255]
MARGATQRQLNLLYELWPQGMFPGNKWYPPECAPRNPNSRQLVTPVLQAVQLAKDYRHMLGWGDNWAAELWKEGNGLFREKGRYGFTLTEPRARSAKIHIQELVRQASSEPKTKKRRLDVEEEQFQHTSIRNDSETNTIDIDAAAEQVDIVINPSHSDSAHTTPTVTDHHGYANTTDNKANHVSRSITSRDTKVSFDQSSNTSVAQISSSDPPRNAALEPVQSNVNTEDDNTGTPKSAITETQASIDGKGSPFDPSRNPVLPDQAISYLEGLWNLAPSILESCASDPVLKTMKSKISDLSLKITEDQASLGSLTAQMLQTKKELAGTQKAKRALEDAIPSIAELSKAIQLNAEHAKIRSKEYHQQLQITKHQESIAEAIEQRAYLVRMAQSREVRIMDATKLFTGLQDLLQQHPASLPDLS